MKIARISIFKTDFRGVGDRSGTGALPDFVDFSAPVAV